MMIIRKSNYMKPTDVAYLATIGTIVRERVEQYNENTYEVKDEIRYVFTYKNKITFVIHNIEQGYLFDVYDMRDYERQYGQFVKNGPFTNDFKYGMIRASNAFMSACGTLRDGYLVKETNELIELLKKVAK